MATQIEAAARRWHEAGFCIIPIRADGSKAPDWSALPEYWDEAEGKNKHGWKPFQSTRPSEADLSHWWGNGTARGIAVVWGAVSGNGEALDFDAIGLYDDFDALCREHGHGDLLNRLLLVETPSGGRHLLYRCETPVPGNQKLAQRLVDVPEGTDGARLVNGRWAKVETLIETRGEGGYTLAPGSPPQCHPDGKPYRFLQDGRPNSIPIITAEERSILLALASTFNEYAAPERIVDAPRPARENSNDGSQSFGDGLRSGDDYNARGDYERLLERHGWRRTRSAGEKDLWQRPGKQGRGISATSNYAGSGLFYVFSSNAAPFDAETAYSPFAVFALLEHGGDFTEAARVLGKEGFGDQVPPEARRGMKAVAKAAPSVRQAAAESPPEPFRLTDLGNGQRLAARHGSDLRYCHDWGKWMVWDGQRWLRDDTGEVDRRAKDTARSIFQEAADCRDTSLQTELAKHALRSQGYARLQAMIALAKSEVPIPARVAEWDRHPWLLACDNGTVDLKTGRRRESLREDLGTKRAGAAYDPNAPAPTWEAFLERVLPDADVRGFVQRAIGYALTGDVTEQVMFFLHGGGSNGKSTLLRAVMDAMGDFSLQAAPDLLIAKEGAAGGPNNDVAELQGTRFVATIEVEDGKRMAEGLVKQITGGDKIKARYMRQDYFEFEPTHKIFLAANHKPTIKGQDTAIWRRVKVIPFDVQITGAEKDPRLPEKLRSELPGILAWAVRGCLEWQRIGLAEPKAVKAATDEYQVEQDVLSEFLEDKCVLRPTLTVTASALLTAYNAWCEEISERPLGRKNFGTRLRERKGIIPATGIGPKAARGWVGIGLRSDVSDVSDVKFPISISKTTHEGLIPNFTSETSETSEDNAGESEREKEGEWETLPFSPNLHSFAGDELDADEVLL